MGHTQKSSNSLDIRGQRNQEGADLPEPHPVEPVLPIDNTAIPPIGGPPDAFHCWVISNWTSHCPPSLALTPRFLKRSAKYARIDTCTRTHMHAYVLRYAGQELQFLDPGAWAWVRNGSGTLPPTSPRSLSVGRCRGGRQPLDRVWTRLSSPGPEVEKFKEGAKTREAGMVGKCPA